MSNEKTEEKDKPEEKPQEQDWICLCNECPGRAKCYAALAKSGALKKLGIKNPDEMSEKLVVAALSFLAGVATDEILRLILQKVFTSKHRRKRFFER